MGKGRGLLAALAVLVAAMAATPGIAQASFPGTNGKIAFGREVDTPIETRCTYLANADGAAHSVLLPPCDTEYRTKPRWSPDGAQIAYEGWAGQLDLVNADGTNLREFFFDTGVSTTGYSWSPDGTEIVISWFNCAEELCVSEIGKLNAGDGTYNTIHTTTEYVAGVDWSADGKLIAFTSQFQLYTIKPDGTSLTPLAAGSPGENHSPSWSPNVSKIAFVTTRDNEGINEIYVMNADGTGQTRLTDNFAEDTSPRWSPDGTKIIFESDRDDGNQEIYVMNANGTGQTRVTNNPGFDSAPDWQPIPVNSYVRPASATPVRASLVPAYATCTSPNRAHGTPLAHPSCHPPDLISSELTVGTPESNGIPANFSGFVLYKSVVGDPGTPTVDEADLRITVQVKDVFRQATLTDYTGELLLNTSIRRTDKQNSPHPGGPGAGTVAFHILFASIPCTATGSAVGATCGLTTTADALVPGIVTEGKRTIWAFGSAQLKDGGPDGDADTQGDNSLFMTQGLFVP